MPGLSQSELGIVLFILLLVVAAGKLRAWGDALGSYFYRRGGSAGRTDDSDPGAPKA
jgi:Sec-independent protein translocase protein TatA